MTESPWAVGYSLVLWSYGLQARRYGTTTLILYPCVGEGCSVSVAPETKAVDSAAEEICSRQILAALLRLRL